MKTSTDHMQTYRQRQKELKRKRLEIYVTDDEHDKLKAYLKELRK